MTPDDAFIGVLLVGFVEHALIPQYKPVTCPYPL